MRKIVVGLIAALALGAFVKDVRAQASGYGPNIPQTASTNYTINAPNLCANANGTYYLCLGNGSSAPVSSWNFGLTTSPNVNNQGGFSLMTLDFTPAVTENVPNVKKLTVIGGSDLASVGGGVQASTTVPVSSSYEQVIGGGAGSAITLTSTPNISTTNAQGLPLASGTELILTSTAPVADAVIFQSTGTLANSGLRLGASTRSLFFGRTLSLVFNANLGIWTETNFQGN